MKDLTQFIAGYSLFFHTALSLYVACPLYIPTLSAVVSGTCSYFIIDTIRHLAIPGKHNTVYIFHHLLFLSLIMMVVMTRNPSFIHHQMIFGFFGEFSNIILDINDLQGGGRGKVLTYLYLLLFILGRGFASNIYQYLYFRYYNRLFTPYENSVFWLDTVTYNSMNIYWLYKVYKAVTKKRIS